MKRGKFRQKKYDFESIYKYIWAIKKAFQWYIEIFSLVILKKKEKKEKDT